jgi:hypothetical protein
MFYWKRNNTLITVSQTKVAGYEEGTSLPTNISLANIRYRRPGHYRHSSASIYKLGGKQIAALAAIKITNVSQFVSFGRSNWDALKSLLTTNSTRCETEREYVKQFVNTIAGAHPRYLDPNYIPPLIINFPPISRIVIDMSSNRVEGMDGKISKEIAAKIPDIIEQILTDNLTGILTEATKKVYNERLAAADAEYQKAKKALEELKELGA